MKNKTVKIIVAISCSILLIGAIVLFIFSKNIENKTKNPDEAVNNLLATVYTTKYDNNVAKKLLGKTHDEYFEELRKNGYDSIFSQLSTLGEDSLVNGKNATDISEAYTNASINLIKKVKEYSITDKQEIENGYQYTIKIVPTSLEAVYKESNDCAVDWIYEIQTNHPLIAEKEGYQAAAYYYCIAEAMNKDIEDKGKETTVNIIVKKNENNEYIPDAASVLALISAVY